MKEKFSFTPLSNLFQNNSTMKNSDASPFSYNGLIKNILSPLSKLNSSQSSAFSPTSIQLSSRKCSDLASIPKLSFGEIEATRFVY
jgi:hypothetical protein